MELEIQEILDPYLLSACCSELALAVTSSPWLLYECEAKRRCSDVNKNLEYESKRNDANVARIVLLGFQDG